MVSEFGLNEPPPPKIVMLAVPIGLQLGCGLGLGEELGPGDGLGLGEILGPGEGLGLGEILGPGDGLGLGPWASVTFALAPRKSTPRTTTTD